MRELVDDLDGLPTVATVRFGYDSHNYEIDLSEAHAAGLEEVLAPYPAHARRLAGSGGRGHRPPPTATGPHTFRVTGTVSDSGEGTS